MCTIGGGSFRTADVSDPAAGRWTQGWDGLDADGRAAPSGIYFLRLETATSLTTRRVIRLR